MLDYLLDLKQINLNRALSNPNGKLMLEESIKYLDLTNVSDIYIVFLKKHIDLLNIKDIDNLEVFKKY